MTSIRCIELKRDPVQSEISISTSIKLIHDKHDPDISRHPSLRDHTPRQIYLTTSDRKAKSINSLLITQVLG
ncbi:hypothetical protein MJO28_016663 [Puccinia striiformis f. sp. tritici]|uniref:Uncharacterized protein n=1 Tax=Puccinia striiformis f. sp. tritici TaxID=168172 RepID=A0ACC0DNW8_9BASI|nr:hypothetical protein MJO28_016663 [Puccinia striiformis f. sp. tritici]